MESLPIQIFLRLFALFVATLLSLRRRTIAAKNHESTRERWWRRRLATGARRHARAGRPERNRRSTVVAREDDRQAAAGPPSLRAVRLGGARNGVARVCRHAATGGGVRGSQRSPSARVKTTAARLESGATASRLGDANRQRPVAAGRYERAGPAFRRRGRSAAHAVGAVVGRPGGLSVGLPDPARPDRQARSLRRAGRHLS